MKRDKALLVRAAREVLYGFTTPLEVWGPYLLPGATDVKPDLQDRIFPIYFSCLLDMIEAGKDKGKLDLLAIEAEEAGYEILAHNCRVIATLCKLPMKAVLSLTADEQAILVLVRHRFVHGYLDGASRPERKLRLLVDGKLIDKEYSRSQLIELAGEKLSLNRIRILRWKFMSHSEDLWKKLEEMFINHAELSEALMRDSYVFFEN